MASKFAEVSKKIINDSIEKVLYVDNEIAMPFQDNTNPEAFELCSKLFSSFKENNSLIDFYEFSDFDEWKSSNTSFFKGIDLLILDWKLNEHSKFGFESSLKILDEAIQTDSLHFVNIYTTERGNDLEDIRFYIHAYYSGLNKEFCQGLKEKIESYLEDEGENPDDILDELKDKTLRLNKTVNAQGQVFKSIIEWFDQNFKSVRRGFEEIILDQFEERNLLKAYCKLSYVLNPVIFKDKGRVDFSSKTINDSFLYLNHTIIQVSQKGERKPEDFYESFRDAVIQSSNNYLTIMGLEMRNRFKTNSAFIGKDIDQISDLAFFFHKEHNDNSEDSFYDFMKNIWRDQASSFLYSEGMDLQIFDSLEDYKEENEIDKCIEKDKNKSAFNNDLALLNNYYNILRVNRKDSDKIKFGDIFSISDSDSDFLLCITAHCDCLYPDKINHSLFFVKGTKGNIEKGLKEGDTGFSSYLADNKGKPFVIDWSDKPVSIYIDEKKNIVGETIPISLYGKEESLDYVATIKDNYTQRIANKAFSYPLRVGIYFADRKDLLPNLRDK